MIYINKFNDELKEFLEIGSTSFTCTSYIKEILLKENYQELKEVDDFTIKDGKFFVIRNDASIIAFKIPKNFLNSFLIVATHTDTPSFIIKPNPEFMGNGYLKLNVMPYGGILNYGFMDTPFSIAGRIILKTDKGLEKKIIDLKESIAIIPSVAIHQNDKANANLDLNTEIDLMPIIDIEENSLKDILKKKLGLKNEIYDYDLFLYRNSLPVIINDKFLASPRIDNLTCTYAALKAFLEQEIKKITVFIAFNSEEIGSNTFDGADGNFLIDTLKKIATLNKFNLNNALLNSFIISADNTHARHPNHKELNDYTNIPKLGDGVVIMREINGTTNGITASIFKNICDKNNIPISFYTSRNDFATGSTLANFNLRHFSINSLDIGLPMLAMHSSMELIGLNDTFYLYKSLKAFYQTNFYLQNNEIIFK